MTSPPARYRRASVREIVDSVATDPVAAQEAHDGLWAAIWARKYQDVSVPVWSPDAAYPGVVVYGRDFLDGRALVLVDTDERLIAVTAPGPTPPVGSSLVVAATSNGGFAMTGIQSPGLEIELRFDDHDLTVDGGWVDRLREALHRIREAQAAKRAVLERERRKLGYVKAPPAIEDLWRDELAAIRERVEMETLFSADELDRLERARERRAHDDPRKQRDGAELERALILGRQQRFDERARAEIDALKARWPDVVAERNAQLQTFFGYKAQIQRIESQTGESRAVTDLTWGATRQLDDIERAGLRVRHLILPDMPWDDPASGREIVRTIDVVHRAIASRMRHLVAEARPQPRPGAVTTPRIEF